MATVDCFAPVTLTFQPPLRPGETASWIFDPHPTHNNGSFIVTARSLGTGRESLAAINVSVVTYRTETAPGSGIFNLTTGVNCNVYNAGGEDVTTMAINLTRIKQ
jgi:hypothetical protein